MSKKVFQSCGRKTFYPKAKHVKKILIFFLATKAFMNSPPNCRFILIDAPRCVCLFVSIYFFAPYFESKAHVNNNLSRVVECIGRLVVNKRSIPLYFQNRKSILQPLSHVLSLSGLITLFEKVKT